MNPKKPVTRVHNAGWFASGKSGNPKGRPAKVKQPAHNHASALDIVINKTLTITRSGVERKVTAEEALQHRTYQDAVAGKRLAQREVLRWVAKLEAWLARHRPQAVPIPAVRRISPDPDNVDQALVLLGIASVDEADPSPAGTRLKLLLETWAVQAALKRRRSAVALVAREAVEIRRCTREAESLHWPPIKT